jgi:hypothetical protein
MPLASTTQSTWNRRIGMDNSLQRWCGIRGGRECSNGFRWHYSAAGPAGPVGALGLDGPLGQDRWTAWPSCTCRPSASTSRTRPPIRSASPMCGRKPTGTCKRSSRLGKS